MSNSESTNQPTSRSNHIGPSSSGPISEKTNRRLDQAHEAGSSDATEVESNESTAPDLPMPTPLEGQATELADWLQKQHRIIEKRSHAIIEQEQDLAEKVASAEQWIEEQRKRLDERESELEGREVPTTGPSEEALEELAKRQEDLDRRQLELDEQSQTIAAERAKLGDQQSRLDKRSCSLDKKAAELKDQESEFAARRDQVDQDLSEVQHKELSIEQYQEQLTIAEKDLQERERRLELRHQEIETAIDRYERLDVAERRIVELQESLAAFAKREVLLEETESVLSAELADLAKQKEDHERQSHLEKQSLVAERNTFEEDKAAWLAEQKSIIESSERRHTEIDRRETALERMQTELQTTQRELLEMRLATEETWAQLTGILAPAALTKSISKVRAELADHYQHALQQISEGRGKLKEASAKISSEFESLEKRRIAVEEWAARRHDDLGQAAARLEGREKELNRQQRQYEAFEARWAAERESYRQQIKKLLNELRDSEPQIKLYKAA